jgi:hypothetical protein
MVKPITSQPAATLANAVQAHPASRSATPAAQTGMTAAPSQGAKESHLQKAAEVLQNLAHAEASQPPAAPTALSRTNTQTAHRAYTLKTGGS